MTVGTIISARGSRPVEAVPIPEMRALIADAAVDEAFNNRCEPLDAALLDAVVSLVTSEIYTTYASWRVDEIRIAFRAGACSQLGPMYKLSPAEFIRIMELYHTCPLRQEALRAIRREAEKPKPVDPAAAERMHKALLAKVALECYADVAACGRITYYSDGLVADVFDFLLSTAAIKYDRRKLRKTGTAEERMKQKRQALEEVFRQMIADGREPAVGNPPRQEKMG